MLADYFRAQGCNVLVTKEPGGTKVGEIIRDLLLSPEYEFSHPMSEIMLFTADRLEHVEMVVRPALAVGTVVICDRYVDSTYAYQCEGRGLPVADVNYLIERVGLMPDLTLVLDMPVEQGLQRAKDRAALDRFEKEEIGFHERVRQGFLTCAAQDPERVKVNAVSGLSPQAVFELIQPHVESKLKEI